MVLQGEPELPKMVSQGAKMEAPGIPNDSFWAFAVTHKGPAAEGAAHKSAAVRSAPLVGVLGTRVEKPRLTFLFLLRTDKVSSLGACTHLTF